MTETVSRRIRGWLALVPLFSLPVFLGASTSPQGEAGFLWVAHAQGLLNVATDTGAIRFGIPLDDAASAVAVNEVNGDVWVHGGRLYGHTRFGELLASAPVPAARGSHRGRLVVDGGAGVLWLAVGRELHRFDHAARLEQTIALPERVVALSLDAARSVLWVAMGRELHAYDAAGRRVVARSVDDEDTGEDAPDPARGHSADDDDDDGHDDDGEDDNRDGDRDDDRGSAIRAIAFDASLQQLWVAMRKRLRRYDVTGNAVFGLRGRFGGAIAADGAGGLWLARRGRLRHLDTGGHITFERKPMARSEDALLFVAADRGDFSVWVGSKRKLWHYAIDGELLHRLATGGDGARRLRGAAIYADLTGPEVRVLEPAAGAWVADSRPALKLAYFDLGVGVDPQTVRFSVAGQPLAVTCESGAAAATCRPAGHFDEGKVTVAVTVADAAGNVSAPAFVEFTVDTVAPASPATSLISVVEGAGGSATVSGQAGSVEPGTRVTVRNQRTGQSASVIAAADGSFSLGIQAGPGDELSIVLADAAGNASAPTLKSVGSILTVTAPADGASIAGDSVLVSGTLRAPARSGVAVNGVPAALVPEGAALRFHARVALQPGSNTLEVVATVPDGPPVSRQFSVTRIPAGRFAVTVSAGTGFAPLNVVFTVEDTLRQGIAAIEMDLDGNSQFETTRRFPPAVSTHAGSYAAPGGYTAVFNIRDSFNGTHRLVVPVLVLDRNHLDQHLRGIWSSLASALQAGNRDAALGAMAPGARGLYGQLFDVLAPNMQQIFRETSAVQPLEIAQQHGSYLVLNVHDGTPQVFVVSFVQGADGVWRIDSM